MKAYPLIRFSFFMIALFLGGCRTQPWGGFPSPAGVAPRWPPSPETARVVHVMDLRSQEDLFKRSGFWQTVQDIVIGSKDSSLSRPYALALHPQGGLLVTDPGRKAVHFFRWSDQKYFRLGDESTLSSPVGVAALADGRILVSDSRRKTVEAFSADGKQLAPFVAPGILQRPAGIAVDEARGRIYVADVISHRVGVFNGAGQHLGWIGRRGTQGGEFNFPTNLAIDSSGRLVVVDSMNFRIQILNPDGKFVRSFGQMGAAPGMFANPKGVAVDKANRIIVVESLYDALEFFDEFGELLLHMGSAGQEPGQFWLAAGLALDRDAGRLFVADSYNSRVQVFQLIDETTMATALAVPASQPRP